MSKLTFAAATIALALAGGTAFADDNSMSQWTGDSYKAFEAARAATNVATPRSVPRTLNAIPDNSLSQFNGDSYAAFESARTSDSSATTVASVRPHTLNAIPDNSMSQFNGDSYVAFESARKSLDSSATSVAGVRERGKASREVPAGTTTGGHSPHGIFRDEG
jgi:hypothetical protein